MAAATCSRPAESATREAILMAGFGKFKVISIDYRMPPDFPYPAAMDDAMAVWKEVVKTSDPKKMAIFGTSTGGGMTLAMVLRARTKDCVPPPRRPALHGRTSPRPATASSRTRRSTIFW